MTDKAIHSNTLKLKTLIINATSQALSNAKNPGLLFSGGIDSSILAVLLTSLSSSPISLIVSGTKSSKDVSAAQTAASLLDSPVEIRYFTIEELEKTLPEILAAAKSTDVLQVSLAIPLFFAAARANDLGISTLFTGQGADELFGGYARFERLIIQSGSTATIAEMKNAFNYLLVTTLPCQQAVAQYHKVKLAAPYLNPKVISFATNLPLHSKILISEDTVIRKRILRQLAKTLNLPSKIISAPKRAAQYGSGASRLLTKLAKQFWKNHDSTLSHKESITHDRIQHFLLSLQNG